VACPNCGLVSPPKSGRCDCGYDFSTRQAAKQDREHAPGRWPGEAEALKRPNPLLKVAAVVSSGLLLSAFIGYHSGAFNELLGIDEQPAPPIMGGSKSIGGTAIVLPSPDTSGAKPPSTSEQFKHSPGYRERGASHDR
jgi:hypothetical protein